jgi:hypothetical protein
MGLFLSEVLGGPEQMDTALTHRTDAICRSMEYHKGKMIEPEDGSVNVVFQFPGSLLRPEFVGVRRGRFSKKKNMLVVEVGFPAELLHSDKFIKQYGSFVKEAVSEAKRVFDKHGVPFSLEDHLALVDKSMTGIPDME